jgi:hypothetical protein
MPWFLQCVITVALHQQQKDTVTTFKADTLRPLMASVTHTCKMHPEVISDTPGKCPKYGIELILEEGSSVKK